MELPNPNVGDGWKGYLYMAHSTFDGPDAFTQYKTLKCMFGLLFLPEKT